MMFRWKSPALTLVLGLAAVAFVPVTAHAQSASETTKSETKKSETKSETKSEKTDDEGTVGKGESPQNLPPARSTNEERPPPPAPVAPKVGVVKQAGIGGDVAYARARVLELGGTAGFTAASDFTQVTIAPSLGWFVIDNLELSGIVQFSHVSTGGQDANFVTLLAEPSFHIPIQDYLFGFAGLGAGLTWIEGPGAGFALAPRVGLNIMVGRSGVLTPQLQLQYSTHEAVATNQGSLLAVSVTYGGGIGYTVMW